MYFSISTGQHLKQGSTLLHWKPFSILLKAWVTNAQKKYYWKKIIGIFCNSCSDGIVYNRSGINTKSIYEKMSDGLLLNLRQPLFTHAVQITK